MCSPLFDKSFIAHLSGHLQTLNEYIQKDLEIKKETLEQRIKAVLESTEEATLDLTNQYLTTLQRYLNDTLPDLLRLILQIGCLAREYDRSLDAFVRQTPRVIGQVESCLDGIRSLMAAHSNTIQQVSQLTLDIGKKIEDHGQKAKDRKKDSRLARSASVGLTAVSIVGGAGIVAAELPVVLLMTFAALATSGTSMAGVYAVANKKMAQVYTEAGEQLEVLKGCNGEFESPLGTIYNKLAESQSHLRSLQRETGILAEEHAKNRRVLYAEAQREARDIKTLCDDIQENAGRIKNLGVPDTNSAPLLSQTLKSIQHGIQVQVEDLGQLIEEKNRAIFTTANNQTRALLTLCFLRHVQEYLHGALPDLFRSMARIRRVAQAFESDFEAFGHLTANILLREIESCSDDVCSLTEKHLHSTKNLSGLAIPINEQLEKEERDATHPIRGTLVARIDSVRREVADITFQPMNVLTTTAMKLAGDGDITPRVVALIQKSHAKISPSVKIQLTLVQRCIDEFQSPLMCISSKLGAGQGYLRSLQSDTEVIADEDEEGIVRQDSFRLAREDARAILALFDEIQQVSSDIMTLSSQLSVGNDQFTRR
ncbi:hypothetical protein DFQ27_001780 [Actinomortierella ambigua]|uniref:Uncharacterized protein n=1 Tax=Actinomortierella ambigua TaxID=1343610 RepID=A0A9P6U7Z2_9FUNG|nr:hypothetical protein DFQ27_001780 [Actinomortierella ambigua]